MTSKRIESDVESTGELWGNLETAIKATGLAVQRVRKQIASGEFEAASQAATEVRSGLENLARMRDEVGVAEREFKAQAERRFSELESDLRAALSRRGWKVDGTWPSLYVERGIAIEIDEKSHAVEVSGRRTATATAKDVVNALEALVPALLPKKFTPQSFMDQVAKAYDEIKIKGPNAQVLALEVYRGLVLGQQQAQFWRDARRDRFQELSLDQFRARLSRCLESGCTSTSDRRELRVLPPLDPRESIYVYQPAELRFAFVGRIEFVKV